MIRDHASPDLTYGGLPRELEPMAQRSPHRILLALFLYNLTIGYRQMH